MIGVYAIRNMANDKMYIGKSDDIIKRWKSHQKELKEVTKEEAKCLIEKYNIKYAEL